MLYACLFMETTSTKLYLKTFQSPSDRKNIKNEWGASVRITVRQHNHHTSWIPVPENRYNTLCMKLRATLLTITNIQEEQVTPNLHKFSMPLREKGSLVEEATKTLYLCQRQSKCQTSHHLVIFTFSPSYYSYSRLRPDI